MKNSILILFLALVFSGCAVREKKQIVVPDRSPDIPAVVEQVRDAQQSTARAKGSAEKASAIAEEIAASNSLQERQLAQLKLEIATTVRDLRLTEESLSRTAARVETLQEEVRVLTEWGVGWQREAHESQARLEVEKGLVEKHRAEAGRAGRERDVFVRLFAISLTVCGLLVLAPLIRSVSAAAGSWGMAAAAGMYFFAVGGLYLGSFWLVRWILRALIVSA